VKPRGKRRGVGLECETDARKTDARCYAPIVVPRSRPLPEPVEAKLSPENARSVRQGIAEARRGEFVDLSEVELRRYLDTGELPERIERWLDSSDSLHAT
jgi:hypothetical protein